MNEKRPADWDVIEREYRANIKSLRQIAEPYAISEGAIRKRAKKDGWDRDLGQKIKAKAEALVRKEAVRSEVRIEGAAYEKEIIDGNARAIADVVIGQRKDVQRARGVVQKLWEMIESELDGLGDFSNLGEMLRWPDDNNQDKLNDLYQAAIGLPQQVKNVKLLADSIKVLIELERKVLRLDDIEQDDPMKKIPDDEIESRLTVLLRKAGVAGAD
jgi:hypothetical protein